MRIIFAFLAFLVTISSFSQQKEQKVTVIPKVHFRTFWMSTSYPSEFKSDFALGSSLNLGGELRFQDRIKVNLGYRFFGNLWSSDLGKLDAASGQHNRYETGLFDLLDSENKFFGKIETLSFSYSSPKWGIVAGRMGIDSDWINLQDGRLAPTAIEGLNLWLQASNRLKITFWGIGKMSVRGSSEWFGVGESLGIFPTGRSVSGSPGRYFQQTQSDWISVLELSQNWDSDKVNVSVTTVENISNTVWLTGEHLFQKEDQNWLIGMQVGIQHGLGTGGNPDPELAYKDPKDRNFAFSTRLGYSKDRFTSNLNFTQVGGKGRWLSPREWGKDAWYTFIPRERNEGFSKLTALTWYLEYDLASAGLTPYIHIGVHFLPDMKDVPGNKYNFPSYRQFNVGLKYQPINWRKFSLHALIMNKEALKKKELTPNQQYNKVGMIHANLILNWKLN